MKTLPNRRACVAISLLLLAGSSLGHAEEVAAKKFLQHSQVISSEKCIECHESEVKAWQETKHFANKDLHKNEKAAEISRKMGITSPAKIRESGLCTQCHFTVQKLGSAPAKAIEGVSCQSCHGGAKDWLDIHNTGDRRESDDTPAAKAKRIAESQEKGMLYPDMVHEVAANCYSCHIITDEKLVNQGGHPAGSSLFELVSWMGGEVRHNFFESKGEQNAETSIERKRELFIVGKCLEMQYSMLGLARAKEKADYGKAMGQRCVSTRKEIDAIVEALGADVPAELKAIQDTISQQGLMKFFNVDPLTTAAAEVEKQIAAFVENHDGDSLGAIDSLMPSDAQGKVYQP